MGFIIYLSFKCTYKLLKCVCVRPCLLSSVFTMCASMFVIHWTLNNLTVYEANGKLQLVSLCWTHRHLNNIHVFFQRCLNMFFFFFLLILKNCRSGVCGRLFLHVGPDYLTLAQLDHFGLLCHFSCLFVLESWNNCAYDGSLSCYVKVQTPAEDLDYLCRWILADSCYFIIPQVERCLDNMTCPFFWVS